MISKRTSSSRNSLTDDESEHDENFNVTKKISSSRKKHYKKWTKEEDERLKEFINTHHGSKDWSKISQYVGNGRTDAQCQHRWERFLDPSITKGPWTDEEDRKVIELVRDYGARQWSLIAKQLTGRVGKQCRERWHNHLNPAINKNPWTNDENLLLFVLHQHFGNKWAEIAKYFNGRSDNSIKNHWNSSMKKKFELEVANLKRQGLDWTALIPPDFPWPKIDKPSSSSRTPLSTITNRTNSKRSLNEKSLINNDTTNHVYPPPTPTTHNDFHMSDIYSNDLPIKASNSPPQENSSQDLERLFYCTPPSPAKQLPMLSSCANYTPSSQNSQPTTHQPIIFAPSIDFYSSNHHHHHHHHQSPNMYPNDETFSLNFNSQNDIKQENDQLLIDIAGQQQQQSQDIVISPKTISNTSSPSKHRVLNTPERLDRPHRIHLSTHDWFNDFVSSPPDLLTNTNSDDHHDHHHHTSIRPTIVRKNKRLQKYQSTIFQTKRRLFNSSIRLRDELGYDPTYTEILIGQTRDQLFVTEQARRYLSCSSLNIYNS